MRWDEKHFHKNINSKAISVPCLVSVLLITCMDQLNDNKLDMGEEYRGDYISSVTALILIYRENILQLYQRGCMSYRVP